MDIWKELQEKWPYLAGIGGAIGGVALILHLVNSYLADEDRKRKEKEQHEHNCQSRDACGLSIIIPTKNEELTIGGLMQCLKDQEPAGVPVEVIVVDGFSTDRTPALAREFEAVVYQDHGRVSRARNLGALISKYPHLLFLDADTLLKGNDFLKRMVRHVHDHHVRFGSFCMETKQWDWLLSALYWVTNIYNHANPSGCGAFWYVDRDVFFEMRGFDESILFCEDVGLTRRILRKYSCRMMPMTVLWDERRIKREGVFSLFTRYLAALWTKSAEADELNAIDPGYFERSAGGKYYLADGWSPVADAQVVANQVATVDTTQVQTRQAVKADGGDSDPRA